MFGMGTGVAPSLWSPGKLNSQTESSGCCAATTLESMNDAKSMVKPHGRLVPVS